MNDSHRRVSDALDALTAAVEDDELPAGVVWSLGYLRAWMEDRMLKIVPNETEYVLVPVAEVPTPEQRAAVGRLVAFAEQRFAAVTSDDHWRDLAKSWNATTPADIEAARAVAEGTADGA